MSIKQLNLWSKWNGKRKKKESWAISGFIKGDLCTHNTINELLCSHLNGLKNVDVKLNTA